MSAQVSFCTLGAHDSPCLRHGRPPFHGSDLSPGPAVSKPAPQGPDKRGAGGVQGGARGYQVSVRLEGACPLIHGGRGERELAIRGAPRLHPGQPSVFEGQDEEPRGQLIVENLVKTWEMERSHKLDPNAHCTVESGQVSPWGQWPDEVQQRGSEKDWQLQRAAAGLLLNPLRHQLHLKRVT